MTLCRLERLSGCICLLTCSVTSSRARWPQLLYLIIELPAIWDFEVPSGYGPSECKADIPAEQPNTCDVEKLHGGTADDA
jgi:hypothetical protein